MQRKYLNPDHSCILNQICLILFDIIIYNIMQENNYILCISKIKIFYVYVHTYTYIIILTRKGGPLSTDLHNLLCRLLRACKYSFPCLSGARIVSVSRREVAVNSQYKKFSNLKSSHFGKIAGLRIAPYHHHLCNCHKKKHPKPSANRTTIRYHFSVANIKFLIHAT